MALTLWGVKWEILSFATAATLKSHLTSLAVIVAFVNLALQSCRQYQKAQAIKVFGWVVNFLILDGLSNNEPTTNRIRANDRATAMPRAQS
jgi:hypothetical protein